MTSAGRPGAAPGPGNVLMDAEVLLPYIDRITPSTAMDRMHGAVWLAGEHADAWARERTLVIGEPDETPLSRAHFERLAARFAPEATESAVTLLTKWLIWMFALDDTLDDGPLGGSATAVHDLFDDLMKAVRRGHPRPDARPLEITLVELWNETAPPMSQAWRHHFLAGLEEHRGGCAQEAVNRRTGEIPALDHFSALRRRAAGPFLLDLAEPVLGITPPPAVTTTPTWQVLTQGVIDLILMTNDVVSFPKESERGDVHNLLAVAGSAFGFDPARAVGWMEDEVFGRTTQILSAAQSLPGEVLRLELDTGAADDVMRFARHLLAAPRAHLLWSLESGRFKTAGSEPEPGRDHMSGLNGWHDDGTASLDRPAR